MKGPVKISSFWNWPTHLLATLPLLGYNLKKSSLKEKVYN